jgi:hypothetical protein
MPLFFCTTLVWLLFVKEMLVLLCVRGSGGRGAGLASGVFFSV